MWLVLLDYICMFLLFLILIFNLLIIKTVNIYTSPHAWGLKFKNGINKEERTLLIVGTEMLYYRHPHYGSIMLCFLLALTKNEWVHKATMRLQHYVNNVLVMFVVLLRPEKRTTRARNRVLPVSWVCTVWQDCCWKEKEVQVSPRLLAWSQSLHSILSKQECEPQSENPPVF